MSLLNEIRIAILVSFIKIEFKFSSFQDLIKPKKTIHKFFIKPFELHHPEKIYNTILKYKRFFSLNCLHLAIMMTRILSTLDVKHKFIIGTNLKNGTFKSHAWVESQNFQMEKDGYKEIYSYERP